MAAPTFVQEVETSAWNTTTQPKTTASFSVLAGDILVAVLLADATAAAVVSGGSLTWTARQSVSTSTRGEAHVSTAVVDVDKSMTVSFATNALPQFGGTVLTFRGSDGVGASNKANAISGAPTVNITTTQANSAVVVGNSDTNSQDGTSRVWRANAGTLTEVVYQRNTTVYAAYAGYHADAGSIGTYAVGLSAPGSEGYGIVTLEVKGGTGAAPSDTPRQPTVVSVATMQASLL